MNVGEIQLSAGALSALVMEGLKILVRAIMKNPGYDFPPLFYKIGIPVLNAVMPFVMVYLLGIPTSDPILSMDWLSAVRYVILVALSSLVSYMTNTVAIKPLKEYSKIYNLRYK